MQQDVLTIYLFQSVLIASVGKLIGQSFRRIANGGVTFQSAVFAEQYDVACIIGLQVAVDVASAAAFQMVLEHFDG